MIYPCTIIKDRYNGTYSGGVFTAWNEDCYEIPDEVSGDDTECQDFWYSNKIKPFNVFGEPLFVGKGRTPQEAYNDLLSKVNPK